MATRAQILCGESAITLDDFDIAVEKCRKSDIWHDSHFENYQCSAVLATFRSSRKRENNIPLCKAIATTYRSLCTDPRDNVFALLGLCSDGTDLVPTPNYIQPSDALAINLTRALIWKLFSLDIIVADRRTEDRPSTLPSWAPDWFHAEYFAQEALDFAEQKPDLYRSFLPQPVVRDETVIRIQGVVMRTIIQMTCPVAFENSPPVHLVRRGKCFGNKITPVRPYYKYNDDVIEALLYCLIPM